LEFDSERRFTGDAGSACRFFVLGGVIARGGVTGPGDVRGGSMVKKGFVFGAYSINDWRRFRPRLKGAIGVDI